MIFAATLFIAFTILATAGLCWVLWYHYGWKVAAIWSTLLFFGFVVLGWFVWWILSTQASGL